MPKFFTQSDRESYFSIYSTDLEDVGNYTVTIAAVFDNVLQYDASIRPIPADLIYTDSFTLTVNVTGVNSYVRPSNSAPYLVPEPYDLDYHVGEFFKHSFGPIYDPENEETSLEITMGGAEKFVQFDYNSNELIINPDALDNDFEKRTEYEITITIMDEPKDLDRGITVYTFWLNIHIRFDSQEDYEKHLVYEKYPQVVDLRDETQSSVLARKDEKKSSKDDAENPLPVAYIKSFEKDGSLALSFDKPIQDTDALRKVLGEEVALRWLQRQVFRNETYLTDEGY